MPDAYATTGTNSSSAAVLKQRYKILVSSKLNSVQLCFKCFNTNKFEDPWLLQANPSRIEMTIDLRDLDKNHKECLSVSCSNHILSRQGPLIFNNHKDLGEDSNHTICSYSNKFCGTFDFTKFTHTNITSVPSSFHQKLINSCILLAF